MVRFYNIILYELIAISLIIVLNSILNHNGRLKILINVIMLLLVITMAILAILSRIVSNFTKIFLKKLKYLYSGIIMKNDILTESWKSQFVYNSKSRSKEFLSVSLLKLRGYTSYILRNFYRVYFKYNKD